MDFFSYRNGRLYCEELAVADIVAREGTPAYVYSKATLVHHYTSIASAFAELKPTICYSIKSLANVNILRVLRDLGSGFDVTSGGELARALGQDGKQRQRIRLAPGRSVVATSGRESRQLEVGADREVSEDEVLLGAVGDAIGDAPVRGRSGDVGPAELDPAICRGDQPEQRLQQRALAGAVVAEHCDDLTRRDVDVDLEQHRRRPVPRAQPGGAEPGGTRLGVHTSPR